LILLERHEGAQTSAQILEQFFPGISRRSAESYMQFARAASKLPNFKQFCLERGGYSKGLTMLQSCTEAEIQEFEGSGELRGFTQDEIDRMSVVTMKKALRRAKEARGAAVKKAAETLAAENAGLAAENQALRAALKPQDLVAAQKIFGQMGKNLEAVGRLGRRLNMIVLAEDWPSRIKCLALLHQLRSLVDYLDDAILGKTAQFAASLELLDLRFGAGLQHGQALGVPPTLHAKLPEVGKL
jgi:hypothetical protein